MLVSKSTRVLHIPELLRLIFSNLPVENTHDYDYALVCKDWTDIALDYAWREVGSLTLLFQLLAPLYYDEWTKRYYFRRPIEPTDWIRFKKYNYRIQSLSVDDDEQISSSVYTAIALDRTLSILLPNLREMELSYSPDFDVVLILSHPSITSFRIFMESQAIDIALQYVRARLPNLVDLTLIPNSSTSHTGTIIADTLRALPYLKKLTLAACFLTPSVTHILSKHQDLHSLVTCSPNADEVFSNTLSPNSFPSLTNLGITIPFGRAFACFSRSFTSSPLKRFSIDSIYYEADSDFCRLTSAIAQTQPYLESVRFAVYGNLHKDDQPSSAPFSIVEPFLSCKHITSLFFLHRIPFEPSAAEFISIFKSLPSIRVLYLAAGVPRAKPLHSMEVLYAISLWCPKLTSLSVYLDFNPSRGCPTSLTPFHSLTNLAVGYSPIQTPVLVAVLMNKILPDDCVISYEERELDERTRKEWQTMISRVSTLRLEKQC